MRNYIVLYLLVILIDVNLNIATNTQKRPFYNVGHMVNSIKDVDYYLALGANAIETDVTFSENGTPIQTYHGFPCDCFRQCNEREEFVKYLGYIREITTPGNPKYRKELALVFLDLKTSSLASNVKAVSGQELAALISDHLFNEELAESRVKIILVVQHVTDSDLILGFENELENRNLSHLNDNIGWDVGWDDPLLLIDRMWKNLGKVKNIWQGDGRTNCLGPIYIMLRLKDAIKIRDRTSKIYPNPYILKVYHWTVDNKISLRASLREGVDSIMTNHPERLGNILKENEFVNNFRLATQEDDPFLRFENYSNNGVGENFWTKPNYLLLVTLYLKILFIIINNMTSF